MQVRIRIEDGMSIESLRGMLDDLAKIDALLTATVRVEYGLGKADNEDYLIIESKSFRRLE